MRTKGARCGLLSIGLLLASPACGGRALQSAGDSGTGVDGSSGGSSGSSGSSSGVAGSSGGSSGSGAGSSSGGSSGGGTGACPGAPPAGSCSSSGQVCHYPGGGTGQTDCGCSGGQWQCVSGCSLSTVDSKVDRAVCAPQLRSATSCNPFSGVCGFTFEIPCWGDAGAPLGDLDAGLDQCTAWCKSVAPPDPPPQIGCLGLNLVDAADGGVSLVGTCNGCGI